jgi:hypothetical protein
MAQMPDVVQQGRRHQRRGRPGRLGQRPGLAHVLADRHCFAQIVAGARPGEQLCDGLDSGHDPSSRVSTAGVLARPSRSA